MRRWPLIVGVGAPIALACNALNGSGDLAIDDGTDAASEGAVPPGTVPPGTPPPGTPPATPPPGTDGALRPSYCNGIVVYARYDGTLVTSAGLAPASAPSSPAFITGHFGSAVQLTGLNTAIFYPVGGGLPYPMSEGSVALWFKPNWKKTDTAPHVFFKPSSDMQSVTTNNAGPLLAYLGTNHLLGNVNDQPDGATVGAVIDAATFSTYFDENGFDFFVGGWRRAPSLETFSLNASDAAGASVNDEWAPQADAGFIRVGGLAQAAEGAIDDFAMWGRLLTAEETRAIYLAPVAIGDACGI